MHLLLYAILAIPCLIALAWVWDRVAVRLNTRHKTLGDRMILWLARGSQVGCVDGIRLADIRKNDCFRTTIERALALSRQYDPRRYKRVIRYIHWIVNQATPFQTIEYTTSINACMVEFLEIPGVGSELLAAFYACCLVHEATHGVVDSWGISYRGENKVRVERLCVTEQNRFASRLAIAQPTLYPENFLRLEFDQGMWKDAWTGNRFKAAVSLLGRAMSNTAQPGASRSSSPKPNN